MCYNVGNYYFKWGEKMPKQVLTVGDVKDIEKFLEQQQQASDDAAVKAKIDELIKKLDDVEVKL